MDTSHGKPIPHSDSSNDRFTPNTLLRDPIGSMMPHVFLMAIQLLALAGSPFRYRRELVAVATLGLGVTYLSRPHFTNDFGLAQPFSMAWSTYLATLEKLAADGGPEARFWRIDKPTQEALSYPAFSWQKIRWALVMILNMRGIRWNYQVKNVPPAPERGRRWRFLLNQVVALGYYMLMTDIFSQLGIHLFYTAPDGKVGSVNSKFATLASPNLGWSFLKTLAFGTMPYYMIQTQYTAFSILAVLSGLSKPEDWPPSFGDLSEATTLRNFWGKYWHQTLRRMLNAYSSALLNVLSIKRGTNLSSYTQLWFSFTLSGLGHAASILILPSPANITFSERTTGMVIFFLWQAACITFEDFVIWSWRRLRGRVSKASTLQRLVGYTWVVFTLWYSLPWAGDVYTRMRLGEQPALPFTIVGPLIKKLPIPWA